MCESASRQKLPNPKALDSARKAYAFEVLVHCWRSPGQHLPSRQGEGKLLQICWRNPYILLFVPLQVPVIALKTEVC